MADVEVSAVGWDNKIPISLISAELEGLYGQQLLREFKEIINYYNVYEKGADFPLAVQKNSFVPTDMKLKLASSLIDKEARFMFAVPPDVNVQVDMSDVDKTNREQARQVTSLQSAYQDLIDKVLKATKFPNKLLKACKDCLIGKRVAYTVNFDEENGLINVSFIPSLGFVYDTDDDNTDLLNKLIVFYAVNDVTDKNEQRIYKKKYEMIDGHCHITEGIYNGLAEVIEEEEFDTDFEYIPGGVILNDGLTGDLSGESDLAKLIDFEKYINKMSSADLDAERQNMNPIIYTVDMDDNSTLDLSTAPGAYWDLSTDDNKEGQGKGEVGTIEPKMEYSDALSNTLSRIRASAYEKLDMPDISPEAMQGVVSSGKTLKAIYWSLMVRCDEKFIAWRSQIEHIAQTIIDGCRLYPACANHYINDSVPDIDFEIIVENNYPIQDDQTEEKEMDLQEVHYKVRSKKSYMKKYLGLSDEEVDEELRQMSLERQIEEESSNFMPRGGTSQQNQQNTPTFNDFLEMERQQQNE